MLPENATFFYSEDHGVVFFRTNTVHGRLAIRAFAYSIAAEDPDGARYLLDVVGREG